MTPAELCRCLGDETRLQLVLMLRSQPELCVCELVEALALPQPTVSRHLARLREIGLLLDRRDSQWIYYRLSDRLPAWASEVIDALLEPGRQCYRQTLSRAACC
jgi:ArsR family transcriptional regulator, arsenate/arsenite/antimonite-responsive transcriptional repressor